MASLQSNSTFAFKHHSTGEAWPACRQFYLFFQTPPDRRGMASLQSNLPFHSNTTRQARHGQLAEQIYLFIAKNRHLHHLTSRFARLTTHRWVWTRGYRMTWHMANPCPGDAPGAVEPLVASTCTGLNGACKTLQSFEETKHMHIL